MPPTENLLFSLANETSCVRDIGNDRNPFAGMIHQSVNTCKQDEQFGFCQHRDLGRETVVVPKAQLLHCHRIVFVNDRHDILAFEQTLVVCSSHFDGGCDCRGRYA